MKYKLNLKKISLLFFSVLLVACTGNSNNENTKKLGDVESVVQEVDYDDEDAQISGDPPIVDFEYKESYYYSLLSNKEKNCFDSIKNGMEANETEIVLPSVLSEKETEKVMNIIILATPELFHIKETYTYELNNNGNIEKIYPEYYLNQSDYKKSKQTIDDFVVSYSSFAKDLNEYNAELQLVDKLSRLFNYENDRVSIFGGDSRSSVYGIVVDGRTNDKGFSKLFAYVSRMTGLHADVVIGKIKGNIIDKSSYKSNAIFNETDDTFINKKSDDKKVKVEYDLSKIYMWNIFRIKNQWYHVDLTQYYLIKLTNISSYSDSIYAYAPEYLAGLSINMSDAMASQNHYMYINDNVLGVTPACKSIEYSPAIQKNDYIKKFKSGEIKKFSQQVIDNMLKTNEKFYVFEDESNYHDFIETFNNYYENYNKENQQIISKYEMTNYDIFNAVYIHDVVTK